MSHAPPRCGSVRVAVDAAKVGEVEIALRFAGRIGRVVGIVRTHGDHVIAPINVKESGDFDGKGQVAAEMFRHFRPFTHTARLPHDGLEIEEDLSSGHRCGTFSAALERFYECCLQVLSTQRNMSEAVYEQMFKPMARQSERQLGAFMALHAVELGIAYSPNQRIVEFRNNVIHKGQIPTPEKAYDFCGKVYAEIFNLYETFSKKFAAAIRDVTAHDLKVRSNQLPKGTPTATASGTMFFSIARSENKPTFKEALDEYIEAREKLTGAVPYLKALHLGLFWFAPKHDKAAQ